MATPADQNFTGLATTTTADGGSGDIVKSLTVGDVTYSIDGTHENQTVEVMRTTSFYAGGSVNDPFTAFSGEYLLSDYGRTQNTDGTSVTKLTMTANPFKLNSLAAIVSTEDYVTVVNIKGYSGGVNGTLVASVSDFNFKTVDGEQGTGTSAITYDNKTDTFQGALGENGWGGILTFGSAWDGIDTVVFERTSSEGNKDLVIALDTIDFSDPTLAADTTPPTASATTGTLPNTANAVVQSTETGTAYLVKDSVTVTNLASITGAADNNFNSATISTANSDTNLALTGLVDGTYKVYTVDAAGNLSAAASNSITIDSTAPTQSSSTSASIAQTTATISSTSNEAGTMYYVVTASSTAPTAAQIIAGKNDTGTAALKSANDPAAAAVAESFNLTGLTANTQYYVYFLTVDAAGNQSSVASANFTTLSNGASDTTPPTASATTGTLPNTANAVVQSTETGTAYLVKDSVTVTNLASITGAADNNFNSATISTANSDTNLALTGLVDGTYKVYTVDAAGNLSSAASNSITIDSTAPTQSSSTSASIAQTTATISSTSNEAGTMYYVVTASSTAPSAAQIIAGKNDTGTAALKSANDPAAAAVAESFNLTGLTANTQYYVYFLTVDAAGNQSSVASANFTTLSNGASDTTPPTASATTGTLPNTANAVVQSTETGTAYLVKDSVTVTNLASITGAADNNFNSATISTANSDTNLALTGLVDGTYKVYTVDAAGNLSAAASNSITIDNTAPTFTTSTPADEGTPVAVGSNIVLNFSEAIKAGTGNIVLHPGTGSDLTIAISDASQVSISGSTLTLNPTADLAANTAYEVQIVDTVLTDVAGNAFSGLSSGRLNFTTAAASNGGGGGGGGGGDSSPSPSTPTNGGTFDGVTVGNTTQADGSTLISVPTVTTNRTDDPTTSNRTHADIPIVKDSQGNAMLTVSVPTGVGLNVEGQANAITRDSALTDLIKRIEQKTDAGSDIQTKMKGDGQSFLNALTSRDTLVVQTITPTISGTTAPDQPIIINGNTHADGSKDALVIDASKLPSGTKLTLNNVAFAAIVGAVRVTGGEGQNIAVGDNEDQFIVLGADDDTLYGGGGIDTVGSLGGNDQTFGEAGNDIVYGGTGNDTLTGGTGSDQYNGGLGTDTAILEGSLKDYTVKVEGQKLILSQISTGSVDTLIDIEKVQFRDDSDSWTIQYQNRATELIGDHLGNIQAQREIFGSSTEEQGYLPMGFGLVGDAKAGYDQLNMEGARSDVHLEKNGNAVELTRLKDGAMLSLTNIEAIRFDNGDVTLFAHSQTEAILGRLFQTIINRDGSLTEWKVGTQALKDRVDGNVFAAWFHAQNTALQALKNSDYVQQLYQNTYGRQATNTELSATLTRLDGGSISRDLLAVEIANSSEAITAVGSVMTFEGWV